MPVGIYIPMETRLKRDGIKPFMCPGANMLLDQIVNVLNYETTYLADMDVDENGQRCIVKCAICENADKIGLLSDWSKT